MRATGFSSSCCGSYSTMTLSNLKGGLLTVTPDNRLSTVNAIFKGPSEGGHMREYYLPILYHYSIVSNSSKSSKGICCCTL